MTKKEWQAALEARRRELAAFEEEKGREALEAARVLVARWSVLQDTAIMHVPVRHVRCAAFINLNQDDERECDEIVLEAKAAASGWVEQTYRCGDSEDEWVCPAHLDQRTVDAYCGACSGDR